MKSGETVFGVKGPTHLSQFIELPLQVPFDYLHLVLQGHLKWLLSNLFLNDIYQSFGK
jgi:hypothetical protein